MEQIDNDNQQSKRKYSIEEVDDLARELCNQFSNHSYFKWYCKIIWDIGIPRINELRGRVDGAIYPGRLFTKYVEEDLRKKNKEKRFREFNG